MGTRPLRTMYLTGLLMVAALGCTSTSSGATLGEPGESLLVTFEGRIAMRPPMEGEGLRPTVVVEAFQTVLPGETCKGAVTAPHW